jgi:hypothetical protein
MDKEMIRDYELDIIVKAWRDPRFRKRLLENPKKAIEEEFSVHVPKDMKIFVHEENDNSLHLIVPSVPSNFYTEDLSDDELKEVIGGVMATGHLSSFPNSGERARLRSLQQENDQLRKMIDKLNHDLSVLEDQFLLKNN